MKSIRRASVQILTVLLGVWFAGFSQSAGTEAQEGADKFKVAMLGPFGGDVRSLAVHPERPDWFYLGTSDGQIYLSEDAGQEWRLLEPGIRRRDLVVDNLTFDPQNPDVLYAGTWELKNDQGWLFRTLDGGKTWSSVALGNFRSAVRAVAVAPSDPQVIALGISEGVILSTDAGKTWERITRGYRSLHNVESLAFDPTDSQTLYVGTWHLPFKTTNRGKKWELISAGMIDDSDVFSILVNPRQPENLFASACTGIYRSNNSGSNWLRLKGGLPSDANRTRTLHLDPVEPSRVYAGTTVGLFVSSDAGTVWTRLVPDVVVNTISVQPKNSQLILVGTDDAGILRSTDGGASFQPANRGFIHRQIAALGASHEGDSYFAAVALDRHYGGFFYSSDRGASWEGWNEGLGSAISAIGRIAAGSETVYLGTNVGVFAGVPGQKPWEIVPATKGLVISDVAVGPKGKLLIATAAGLHDLDVKTGKIHKVIFPAYRGPIHTVAYSRQTGKLFAGGDTGIFRSEDAGKTWAIRVKGLPYAPVRSLALGLGGRLYCSIREGLFWSDNEGASWHAGKGFFPLDIMTLHASPVNPDEVFAADRLVGYVFHSTDGGANWNVLNTEQTRSRIMQLLISPNGDVLAGTLSEGVYRISLEQAVVRTEAAGNVGK